MHAYRLVSPRWASTAFSGEGARLYGGRWNPPGLPMVYCSGSRALCALELLVHLTTPLSRKKPYALIEVFIPDDAIDRLPSEECSEGWNDSPAGAASQMVGKRWVESEASLALSVPSSVVGEEANVLINPLHSRFSEVVIGEAREFRFDHRLAAQ